MHDGSGTTPLGKGSAVRQQLAAEPSATERAFASARTGCALTVRAMRLVAEARQKPISQYRSLPATQAHACCGRPPCTL
jgi:hypothetical protein